MLYARHKVKRFLYQFHFQSLVSVQHHRYQIYNFKRRIKGLDERHQKLLHGSLNLDYFGAPGTQLAWCRRHEAEYLLNVTQEESSVYCKNLPLNMIFFQNFETLFKMGLLHHSIQCNSVSIAHSVHLKETYKNLIITYENSRLVALWMF